jgi:hypothetical protein
MVLLISTLSPIGSLDPAYPALVLFSAIGPARAVPCPTYIYPNISTHRLFITLMIEAVSSFKLLVNIYQTTWFSIPEDSHLEM